MNQPVPAPRAQGADVKKPIPTPRRSITQMAKPEPPKSSPEENTNTFSRRVRSLSNASKQIAEDIGGMVQGRKKAVIAGTRQSVRRITKRFNSYHQDQVSAEDPPEERYDDDTIDIFSSISFNSPINNSQSIYNNVDEEFSAPPPSHPPPPLPDDVLYDAPASLSGGSTSNSDHSMGPYQPQNYESVFPVQSSIADSESELSRSGSWRFYDPVPKQENVYTDVDGPDDNILAATKAVDLNSNVNDVDLRSNIYENHVILPRGPEKRLNRPTESVILQFDPLNSRQRGSGMDNQIPTLDMRLLELRMDIQSGLDDNLSSLNTLEEISTSNDSEPDDFLSPPPPPIRFDSLPEEEQPSTPNTPSASKTKTETNWFTEPEPSTNWNTPEQSKRSLFKQMKSVLEKAPDVFKGARSRDAVVQRPELEVKSIVRKRGMLYKVQGGPVEDLFGEYSGRWCILQNSDFVCYSDNTCDSIKEHFPTHSIVSVQILQDPKFKYRYDNDDLHCFELNTTGKSRGGYIYGSRDVSERRIWMQLIAESMTKKFPAKITTDYSRMGWTYLREGVSGKWLGAWLMLSQRTLHYVLDNQPVKMMDLRTVRCLVLQAYQEGDNNPRTNDKGPNIVVDSPSNTLYLRMWTSRETKVWAHIVKLAAHNNGANLEQQQLTKNNIPVVVEKCINFIYVHGSMTEGIYRRPGNGNAVSEILAKFRKDAWAVQLTSEKHLEHDVATALKRFFMDLPDPLLGSHLQKYLCQVSLVTDKEEKIRMYKAALDQLPPISYKTAKNLFGHLHFVASQSSKNLMTIDNLASTWGPSLMQDKEAEISEAQIMKDIQVVKNLIELYRSIFPEDPAQIEQEKQMLNVLEKYKKAQGPVKNNTSGDLRVWIHISKDVEPVNVSIGPHKTAYDVCLELCQTGKTKLLVHEFILEEVVLNDRLTRPIHHSEKVLDIVLRWGYWDDVDRKENRLILCPVTKYYDLILDKSLTMSGELKFADTDSKSFKIMMFDFTQCQLHCYKDKTCEVKLGSWKIEDLVWYYGHEPKRTPLSPWTITFLELNVPPKRTKSLPYFGNVLACTSPQVRTCWLAAMIRSRFPEGLAPPAMHVNLISN